MNIFDICIVLALAGVAYWGTRKRLVTQVSILVGILVGALVAALVYERLAFLGQNSAARGVMLAVLTVAIGFLCSDIILSIGRRLRARFGWKTDKPARYERLASGAVTATALLVFLWLVGGIFGSVLPIDAQRQLRGSLVYNSLQESLPVPDVVRRAVAILNPFKSPEVFVGGEPSFDRNVAVSTTFENLDDAVAAATASVFKVNAWGCGATSAGSGFLTGSTRTIVTNAHVVAGAGRISVQGTGGAHAAQTIWFDPKLDIAVLLVATDAAASPLALDSLGVANGSVVSVMGYPAGKELAAEDAIVVQSLKAEGYDIYNDETVLRSIYALRATIVPGNSGGPLITAAGKVAGVVLGHSTEQNRTGYAISANQVEDSVAAALAANQVVSTGSCTAS